MCLTSISFFFNDTATTEIYTLSLHDALPIYRARLQIPRTTRGRPRRPRLRRVRPRGHRARLARGAGAHPRSEEHTSELQSLRHLVCRLLLEKKKIHADQLMSRLAKHRQHSTH